MREVAASTAATLLVLGLLMLAAAPIGTRSSGFAPPGVRGAEFTPSASPDNASPVGNFSHALGRIVALLGTAGGAILAIAWARVALSWFSNDVTKKIQAKDRARDALIGTVILAAALSGLVWGLAQWILTGA